MAIQKTLTSDDTGATYSAAYWRIVGVTLRPQSADIHVAAFVDAAAAGGSRQPVEARVFRVGPTAMDAVWPPTSQVQAITARAYAYLKTLQDFAGATDA